MRNKRINWTILVLLLALLSSCETSFEDPGQRVWEEINGFEVLWRSQISEHQKDAARQILNDMVFVEGGTFVMGATPEQNEFARPNEYPNAYMRLSDFYIGRYEVSVEQYNMIMGTDHTYSERYPGSFEFQEWIEFTEILKDITGLNFTLPTEAQWEFAARGGNLSKGYVYPGSNEVESIRTTSSQEGSPIPNELGLYNMGDLKSEWCLDFYDELIPDRLLTDWIQTSGKYHVARGGNYLCTIVSDKYYPKNSSSSAYCLKPNGMINREIDYRHCRITSRSYYYDNRSYMIGCRLVINKVKI